MNIKNKLYILIHFYVNVILYCRYIRNYVKDVLFIQLLISHYMFSLYHKTAVLIQNNTLLSHIKHTYILF